MKTTTTETRLLPATTQTRADRTARAEARHTRTDYQPMTIDPQGVTHPQPDAMTPAQLYAVAEIATYLTIRARSRNTGLKMWQDLQSQRGNDNRILFDRSDRATVEALARAEAQQAQQDATSYQQQANRLQSTQEDRDTAQALADEARAERDRARGYAEDIAKQDTKTSTSERATLLQSAIVRAIEMAQDGANHAKDILSELCQACSEALKDLTHPDALTATRTTTRWMTKAEAEAMITRYAYTVTSDHPAHIPGATTRSGATSYRTIEPRTREAEKKKMTPEQLATMATTPDGIPVCMVYHYRTTAPTISYDQYDNPDTVPGLSDNGGINAIQSQTDAERITALLDRANLTDRERLLIMYTASQGARTKAREAEAHQREQDRQKLKSTPKKYRKQEQTRAEARATKAGADARWAYAFDRLSRTDTTPGKEYSTATRDKYRQRIHKAIQEARTTPEAPTPEERREAERKQWERMQSNRHRGHATTGHRADLIAWTDTQTTSTTPQEVRWLTPAQAHNRRARADAEAIKQSLQSRIDNTTPEAIAKAKAGEVEYCRRATEEAKRQEATAQAKAEAKMAEEWETRMRAKGVYSLSTTFQQWKAWTDEEREEHDFFLTCPDLFK